MRASLAVGFLLIAVALACVYSIAASFIDEKSNRKDDK